MNEQRDATMDVVRAAYFLGYRVVKGVSADLEGRCDKAEMLLRKIGGYCDDNRYNTTMLASFPPQNAVAVHVRNSVSEYMRASATTSGDEK